MIEYFIEEIIESASGNSAGTLMNKNAINIVLNLLVDSGNLNKNNVDKLISENETEYGYMVKYSDFNYALQDFLY